MAPKPASTSARNGSQKPKKQPHASPMSSRPESSDGATKFVTGKPDKKVYEEEQNRIKADIDALQLKLSAARDKLSLAAKSGPGNEKEASLRSELNAIKTQQSSFKSNRTQTTEKIRSLQENIQKKVKDLQASRSKMSFRTVEELDAHVKNLEKQVESGTMKLVDEKRALAEISNGRRTRRVIEGFQGDQQRIEEDRRMVDELKKLLDDPEAKALSDRFEAISAELNTIKAGREEANANKSKLIEERDNVQAEVNVLYNEKRESVQRFREANDRYWTKVNEDRARREERRRAQKKAEEEEKKSELVQRLLEEAKIPAYQTEIEDCQTLIDHFSGKSPNPDIKSAPQKTQLAGVPELELRKVEGAPEGVIVRKKGEEEESYFVGGKGKGKGRKSTPKTDGDANDVIPPSNLNASLHIPLSILSALGSLAIPPLTSPADVPRVIQDLKTKKLWFEANQARTTAEKTEKAEAEVKRLLRKDHDGEDFASPVEGPTAAGPSLWADYVPQEDAKLAEGPMALGPAVWVDNELQPEEDAKLDTVLDPEAAAAAS